MASGGRVEESPLKRTGIVVQRGLLNLVGSPVEIYSTAVRERKNHHWIWPVSFVPRTITNVVVRAASVVNDVLISPFFVAPFTTDIRPITEPMGLPDYPWQVEVE